MTVETPERDWTDSRLDDLKKAVGGGHEETEAGFAKVDELFEKVYERMDAGFSELRGEIHRLMLVLVAGLLGIIGTLIAVLLS